MEAEEKQTEQKKKFYITTTLPYVNAKPHIGFALEIVQADVVARFRRLLGDEVFFNFGTDEHGQKIYQKALEEGKDPQAYTDEYAASFDALKAALNLSYDAFIRTTSSHHKHAAQEFWKLCDASGDIYKKLYKIKYCVGCELEKTDSELVEGKCPLHPNMELQIREEENYFFRFSKYQDELLRLYAREDFLIPRFRLNEMISLIEREGLQDFSISRLKAKMPWGVPVPGDDAHVMYVWFDALVNYISTLGWPKDEENFTKFWGTKEKPNGVQFAGKDQVRQQAAMWQAMLMSAGLPNTKQIFIHGFLNINGQKISKSIGNAIDPVEFVAEHGTDVLRYYLLRHAHPFEDSDFSIEKFIDAYNANLANGLGNLVARIITLEGKASLCFTEDFLKLKYDEQFLLVADLASSRKEYEKHLNDFRFDEALGDVWELIGRMDKWINDEKPWASNEETLKAFVETAAHGLKEIAFMLEPFMPETSQEIKKQVIAGKKTKNLFPRK